MDPIKPEILRNVEIAVRRGLIHSFQLHEELGERGTDKQQTNSFGETALLMDIYSEQVMMDALRELPYRFLVRTEEHGEVEINPEADGPCYLVVMDGLDGSSVYDKERGTGNYGPMFVIYDNDDPTYEEYMVAGVMNLSTGEMLIAAKGKDLASENLRTGEQSKVRANADATLDENAVVFADATEVDEDHNLHGFFTLNGNMAGKLHDELGVRSYRTGSTAANIMAVAKGEAVLDIGATRKGNLEFASAYAIIKASGGVMQTVGGEDLGKLKFREFGQGEKEFIPVIAAANEEVAERFWNTMAA